MAVVKVEEGVVTQVWLDVVTLEEFEEKYGLSGLEYVYTKDATGGWLYENGKLVPPPPDLSLLVKEALDRRSFLLQSTDWYVIRSIEDPSKPVPQEMLDYRQALRDIDKQDGWPTKINWPTKPE